MKYFSAELDEKICYGDNPNIKEDEIKWNHNVEMYYDEFRKNSSYFPKSFVKYYLENGFHDDILESFEIVKRRTKEKTYIDIISHFHYDKNNYQIKYLDVILLNTSLSWIEGYHEIGDYIYGEILAVEDNYWKWQQIIGEETTMFPHTVNLIELIYFKYKATENHS